MFVPEVNLSCSFDSTFTAPLPYTSTPRVFRKRAGNTPLGGSSPKRFRRPPTPFRLPDLDVSDITYTTEEDTTSGLLDSTYHPSFSMDESLAAREESKCE